MGRVLQIYTIKIPRYQVFRLFYTYQNHNSISTYILLIWVNTSNVHYNNSPKSSSFDLFVPKSTKYIDRYLWFLKNTSNLRNDDAQKLVIFDLFVPNSQRYVDIYFATFLKHKSKSHYDVQTSRIRYLFDTKITILYHIICIFFLKVKFTL